MIQLTYQPALDPFHTVFRLLRLRASVLGDKPISRDHFRILDFYLLFPFRSGSIRLQQGHRRFKRVAQEYEKFRPYSDIPEDRVVFNRMMPIQGAALDTLVRKGLLAREAFERGFVVRTDAALFAELQSKIDQSNAEQPDLLEFLRALATDYDLLGRNGLKDRTDLMDYSYDAA
jgi:hypothetical protein